MMKKSLIALALFLTLGMFYGCDKSDCRVEEVVIGQLPQARVGSYFEHTLGYTRNCSPEKDDWYLLGSLPPGLQFTSDGVLKGTPTASGNFDITVEIVCFFDEEHDEWNNPIYTERSSISTTFTMTIDENLGR
jgi:hypothetical protein